MAENGPLEQVLLELGIDLTPAQQAKEALKTVLQELNTLADQTVSKTKQATTDQKSVSDSMKQSANEAIAAAKAAILSENQKAAVLKTQKAEYDSQITAQRLLAEEVRKGITEEQRRKAEIQSQTAEIQKQIAEKRKERLEEGGGGEGGGLFSGSRRTIGRALFGGGLGGAIATGVLAGEGAKFFAESAVEGISKFIEKLKEVSIEAGKDALVEDRFNKIAAGAGIDGAAYLDKLRESTSGLVDKFHLAEMGAKLLGSGVKSLTPDQVNLLTGAVTKLALSSGHDAVQAVDALTMVFSRGGQAASRMLSRVTGLTAAQLKIGDLSPVLNRTQRDVESLEHATAVLISEAAKLGEIPLTLQQATTQVHVLIKDLFFSFGEGFNESAGTQAFLKIIGQFTASLYSLEEGAHKFGDTFGKALAGLTPLLTIAKESAILLYHAIGDIVREMGRLGGSTDKDQMMGGIRAFGNALISLKPVVDGFVMAFELIARTLIAMKEIAPSLKDIVTKGPVVALAESVTSQVGNKLAGKPSALDEMQQAWAKTREQGAQSTKDEAQLRADFNKMMDEIAKNKKVDTKIIPREPDDSDRRQKDQLLQSEKAYEKALLAQKRAYDALTYEEKKDAIAEARRLDEEAYSSGEEDLKTHIDTLKRLAKESMGAEIDRIYSDLAAQEKEIQFRRDALTEKSKRDLVGVPPGPNRTDYLAKVHEDQMALDVEVQTARDVANRKILSAQAKEASEEAQADKKSDAELFSQAQKAIASRLSLLEEGIRAEDALNKKRLDGGQITADQYVQLQIASALKIRDEQQAAADASLEAAATYGKLTLAVTEEQNDKMVKAEQQANEKIAAITEEGLNLRLQELQRRYAPQQKALEAQIATQKAEPGQVTGTGLSELIERLLYNIGSEIKRLTALSQTPEAQANPDTWAKINEQLEGLVKTQQQWNDQLRIAKDLVVPIGQSFSSISQGITANFHSKFAQNLGEMVGAGARSITQSSGLGKTLSGPLWNSSNSTSDNMGALATKLGAAVQAVDNFTSSILNAHSAIAGGAGGAMGGFGLGNTLDQVFKGLGPFGAIGGAVIGGVMGAVVGSKQAQVTANINQVQTTFKHLMQDFALNTNNLNNTIQQIESLIGQVQAMQASSKKGSAQYQQVIDQYVQQLQQLQVQQDQTLRKMNEQVAILSAPLGAQSFLGDIQQIVQTYQQFEGAAKNVNDLATANQFLVQSLQQYETTMSTQVLQDNQQAIQDAIQLNDLQYQRQQMTLQYANQVQSVLSAGVLSRTPTRAMTAGQQIQQITVEYQRQMDQLNEQIAATNFRVQGEQTIFNLAQSRIGLENQLLVVQNQQANLQIAQIAALSALLNQFQTGNLSGGPLGSLLGSMQTVSNPAAGVAAGTSILDTLIGMAYQTRASMGFASFRGQNL